MLDDRYRPRFHFTPPAGWMNDPNGLVYFQGEYHLFYQHLSPLHWGHAVSVDLVHWTHLPIALYPDDLGDIWSGSVVVDAADSSGFFGGQPGLVAIFTHHNAQSAPAGPQMQSIAYSHDRGRTWTKYVHNPVIPNPGVADFRDPKVFWHGPSGRWVMVVTFNGDRVRFYTSPDLKGWTLASEYGVGQGAHDGVWECPDLFELPVEGEEGRTRWVLHVSLLRRGRGGATPRSEMQYFVGDFDGTTFINENPAGEALWSDYGRDNYAAVTWSDVPRADGRRLAIGWMNNWTYARRVPTNPWQGAMTIPRRLHLRQRPEGPRLAQTPIVELQCLRGQALHHVNRQIAPDDPLRVAGIGDAVEVRATFELETATECGLRIRTDPAQFTAVAYDAGNALLLVDRTYSGQTAFSPAFSGRQRAPLAPVQGRVALHIFADRSSIEVFGNDGEVVVTSLIFPDSAGADLDLEVYATNGAARLVSLDVIALQPGRPAEDPSSTSSAPHAIRPGSYAPAEGYLWDPWFAWQGDRLHLFHLLQPAPAGADRTHDFPRDRPRIAHATWSRDTGWERRPIALDYNGAAYDAERIHTGCIIRHDDPWLLFYSGSRRYVCLATSDDLETWHRSAMNPLLIPDPQLYGSQWRDPWIYWDPDDRVYTMLLAAQRPGTGVGTVGVARSADLMRWEQQEPLDIPPWFAWLEVPELHRIDGLWYLLFATREAWITDAGREALRAQGVSPQDGAFYLRADNWRGPYRRLERLFPPDSARYTTRLVITPAGERWLWSHVERDPAGRPLFELAAPLAGVVVPDGRIVGQPFAASAGKE
jgi:fructan beta-fructosidase